MNVREAKAIARQWVHNNHWAHNKINTAHGFGGAFFHGSINGLPDDASLPATSDVDIMLIFDEPPPIKLGKFLHQSLLLEVSYLAADELPSAEHLLAQYHLASSFQTNSLIADPTGRLGPIQATVAQKFAQRNWISTRARQAYNKVLHNLSSLNPAAPFHMQVMQWLFATGVMTHVLLVADLQNPTVRRRYATVRALLDKVHHLDTHEKLLELQGSAQISRAQVEEHLIALTEAFDAAKAVVKTPIFFASDISDVARPLAIDGSRAMIEQGNHREAIFWIVATYTRCQQIFHLDAPNLAQKFDPNFRALVSDLGIHSFEDICQRRTAIEAYMPHIWTLAEAIMDANENSVTI